MSTITNWYFVGREKFGYDLSLPIPYAIIKRFSNLEPVLIGALNGIKVIVDNIKDFNEKEKCIVLSNNTIIQLANMHDDFYQLQINILKGYPIIYNWAVDANLSMNGVMYEMGKFNMFSDTIESQEKELITFSHMNKKAFVVWSTMSRQQKEYMESLNDEDLLILAPYGKFEVKNCCLDLAVLIKNKEERDRNSHLLRELDVPEWMK